MTRANGNFIFTVFVHITGTNYSQDSERGTVREVEFRDIAVLGTQLPGSVFRGFDDAHDVAGIVVANLRHNDRPLTSFAEAKITVGPFVRDAQFRP